MATTRRTTAAAKAAEEPKVEAPEVAEDQTDITEVEETPVPEPTAEEVASQVEESEAPEVDEHPSANRAAMTWLDN